MLPARVSCGRGTILRCKLKIEVGRRGSVLRRRAVSGRSAPVCRLIGPFRSIVLRGIARFHGKVAP